MSYPIDSGFLADRYGGNRLTGYVRSDPKGEELTRTSKNDYLVVSIGDVKNYLNVNHDNHDEMIEVMIKSATDSIEDYLGYALLTSTYEVYYRWVFDYVQLPLKNQTISSIKTIDLDGNETTLTSNEYVVLGGQKKIVRFKTVVDKSVLVTYTAGLEDSPKDLDSRYQDAVKSQVKFLYARDFKTDLQVEATLESGLAVEAEVMLNAIRER